MSMIETALVTEHLAQVAAEVAAAVSPKVGASQLFRAVQLATEEDARRKVTGLASHQIQRSTTREDYKAFWRLLRDLANGNHPAVKKYHEAAGKDDRGSLEDNEFRRLVQFLVAEVLYRRAAGEETT